MMAHLVSSVGSTRQELAPIKGMFVAGYVTSTQTFRDGVIHYGPFASKEAAHDWAKNLEGETTIIPIYEAAWNRG